MLRWLALISLAGCGRFGFDASQRSDGSTDGTGDALSGHDEDGDGVPDSVDVCPHLAGDQSDADGDLVGDACDPNPTVARDHIALFATMAPGDQPFSFRNDQGTWVQRDDSIELTGVPDSMGYFFGGLDLDMTLPDARVVFGLDVLDNLGGPQNQFAVGVVPASGSFYYVEVNGDTAASRAQVTLWDGVSFTTADQHPLASGIHTGSLLFQGTFITNSGVHLDASWPGEPYTAQVNDPIYQGGDRIQVNTNGLHLAVRYLCVITSS